MKKEFYTKEHPKTLLVAVQAPYNPIKNIEYYFQEFENLVSSNNIEYDQIVKIKLRSIDSGHFFTTGKLQELADIVKENNIEEVVISEPLTSQQERNLRDVLRAKVFDRTQLILEIFEKGAQSAEGKIQVELAMLAHKKTRLTGRGIHMSQQSGGIGGKGPGETAKESELQHIENQMHKMKQNLEKLEKHRDVQRKQRLSSNINQIALIGYTNAGKSTILNALTKSDVLAEDRLFATLDTTTRELFIDNLKIGLISDTVGFIQLLPHRLIEAFKSTLAELKYAHLLLQVVDISDPNWEDHIYVVKDVLEELGLEDKRMLYVFNKADKIEITPTLESKIDKYQPHVIVSAKSADGLEPLKDFLIQWNPE